jgi:hypothetical protein
MIEVAILIQGPLARDVKGSSTVDILRSLNESSLRPRFHVVCAVWEDEDPERVKEIAPYADRVVTCRKPARVGAGNRNLQLRSVSCGLAEIETLNCKYVLKTRSDILLSDKFLAHLLALAGGGFEKLLVTNLVTRYESFHISDLMVFSTFENIKAYFDPREVYYEDVYSPEVQFARVFIRNKRLNYSMRLESYLLFLREWVELVDFNQQQLVWFTHISNDLNEEEKAGGAGGVALDKRERAENLRYATHAARVYPILYDRDSGPISTRTVSVRFHRFLMKTKVPVSLIAVSLIIADTLWSFALRCFAPFKHKYFFYYVDPKGSEHDKPVA